MRRRRWRFRVDFFKMGGAAFRPGYIMPQPIFTLAREAEAEIEIKRSRFIGRSFRRDAPDAALAAVGKLRESFRDATHHCWAYRIGPGGEQARAADDGEPQGTAGAPILETLKKKSCTNTLIVVTRYFGGTKLGAGGLVRAYGEAARRVLEQSGLKELRRMKELRAPVPYAGLAPLESFLAGHGMEIAGREFGETIELRILIPAAEEGDFRSFYASLVGGRMAYSVIDERWT